MEDGLLSLKWNNHSTTFFEILKGLRDKASYTDATLAAEGKFYPVHKLVLSTCSEYFCEIFDRTPCKSPVIVLKDVRCEDLESLLDYMYLGEVNVKQNDLALLLKTAECLRVKGLAIPDEDASRLPLSNGGGEQENSRESPPRKRRRSEEPSPPSPPHPPSKAFSSSSLNSENAEVFQQSTVSLETAVKVEMDEDEDLQNDDSNVIYGNSIADMSTSNDFSSSKKDTEFTLQSVNNPSSMTTGDTSWEDEENSFPQDSAEDSLNNQQMGSYDEEEIDVTSLGTQNNVYLAMSLTQSKEARRCQLCQMTLANANLLRRHVEDHHFHIRKYDCVHCGKKFKRKEHRERHERIHTGEKPFVCHICSSRFTQKEHLKGHIENVHNKKERDGPSFVSTPETLRDDDCERSISSPPSLASPSSLANIVNSSPLNAVFPPAFSLSQASSSLAGFGNASSSPPPSQPQPNSALSQAASDESGSVMALYAPVTRRTTASPNKHVKTITINFN